MDQATGSTEEMISFGQFRLIPARQQLMDGDLPVHIGSRALDILTVLVRGAGEVVSKEELFARVWPETFVEEGNLRVHIAALRRALRDGAGGKRYIANIPGRGYSFVAPIVRGSAAADAVPAPPPSSVPARLGRMVGRAEAVEALGRELLVSRFVTVVGPGGIGKTTVAIAIAETLRDRFPDGVFFVDLAAVGDPMLVPSALAALMGVGVRSQDALPSVIGFLTGRKALVVLDSCEHVIDAAAGLAECLIGGTSGTCVLATSREALRAEAERINRLSTLAFPAEDEALTAGEALAYPAVELFVERASASLDGFVLRDAEAPAVAEICRRLDGMALAIEIAASWVEPFGVTGLAMRLRDRFQLLLRGRRTALARHQTLSATLDWSYDQLNEQERCTLRRLAVFVGEFTMDSALAVLSGAGSNGPDAIDAIANLVTKSLIAAHVDRPEPLYRLFDVTRAYALGKLEEAGERGSLARLHAAHYRTLMAQARNGWESWSATVWLERYRRHIDNIRGALEWCFAPGGDQATGVALTVSTIPLWFSLSLVSECGERAERALTTPPAQQDPDSAMQLNAGRAWSLMQTKGFVEDTRVAWQRVLDLAERHGDVDHQLRALWGLWAGLQNRSELGPALVLAQRFSVIAADSTDPMDVLVGDRMVGYMLHLMGDQSGAREHLERMVARYQVPVIGSRIIRFVFDQRATAQSFLARILWLQGQADEAERLASALVETAIEEEDVLSLCQVLVQAACPVALFTGDLESADRHVRTLLEHAERHSLAFWQAYGHCFNALLTIRQGAVDAGLKALGNALHELRDMQFGVLYGVFLAEYAAALGQVGDHTGGLDAVETALARARRNQELWYLPEFLRIKGEIVLRSAEPASRAQAETLFREALEISREQHTPAWELRAATSLAKLVQANGSPDEARRLLGPIHARFTEGLETADYRAATAFMRGLT